MPGLLEMPGSVFVLGVVTAAHVAAGQAQAQMHPGIPNPQAVLTAVGAGCDVLNELDVGALFSTLQKPRQETAQSFLNLAHLASSPCF